MTQATVLPVNTVHPKNTVLPVNTVHPVNTVRRVILGAVGVLTVLGAVELALWADGASSTVFPQPTTVLSSAAGMTTDGGFWVAVGQTMLSWAEAMAATIVIAVPFGALLGLLPQAESALRPVLEFVRPIPSVVLFPLILLITLDNGSAVVSVIVLAVVWPVLINTVYGLREVDPAAKETLRAFGFGPLAVAWFVSLPSAAPFVATGMRIAASLAFVVAIAVELVGTGLNGIGGYAAEQQGAGNALTALLATALWCGLIGLALNGVFVVVERRAFRWHHALAGRAPAAAEITAAPALVGASA
jgi:NitT/TauT family transport system permease protein